MAFSLQKKVFWLIGYTTYPSLPFLSLLITLYSTLFCLNFSASSLLCTAPARLFSTLPFFYSTPLLCSPVLFSSYYSTYNSFLYSTINFPTLLFFSLLYFTCSTLLFWNLLFPTQLFSSLFYFSLLSSPLRYPCLPTFIHCLRSAYILFSVIQSFCKKHPWTSTEGRGNSIDIIGSFILHCLVIFG